MPSVQVDPLVDGGLVMHGHDAGDITGLDLSGYVEVAGDTMSGALTITPTANSTSTLNITNTAGASVLNIDSTNQRVGIGTTTPAGLLNIIASGDNQKMLITNKSVLFSRNFADATTSYATGIEGTGLLNAVLKLSSVYGIEGYQTTTQLFRMTTSEMVFASASISFQDGTGGINMIGAIMRGVNNLGLQALDNRFTVTIKQNNDQGATADVLRVQTQSGGAALYVGYNGSVTFNEGGVSTMDVRMESDTEENMFFLDANADTDGALYLGGTTNGIKINKGGVLTFLGTANISGGATGSFTTTDGKTVTVTGGIITAIV